MALRSMDGRLYAEAVMLAIARPLLLTGTLLIVGLLVATHGLVRAATILIAVAVVSTVPRTEAWKASESRLVQLTGSRQRAAVLVMLVVIGAAAAVNIYHLTH